ncbi:MAG: amidohydrolase family protein [Deltaproteobacteria bacterium]|nr:amidohydrolase family protein [Deltaproteobacteria bacterium]
MPENVTIIQNVRIFDGKNDQLRSGYVLIQGNAIARIASDTPQIPDGATVIDGGGRVLMPGMIDTHCHPSVVDTMPNMENNLCWDDIAIRSSVIAKGYLMRGFTSIRDAGGPVFGLKRSIDAGLVNGPRIYPSGAFLSQTRGHGDFRSPTDRSMRITITDNHMMRLEYSVLADGEAQVLAAAREQLGKGASQVKIMASGGGASLYDPIDTVQYTLRELKAAVATAEDWGTYVFAHTHNCPAMWRAAEAGIKTFEHGFLADEETMRMIVDKGIILSTQVSFTDPDVILSYDLVNENPVAKAKVEKVLKRIQNYINLVLKHQPIVTFTGDGSGPAKDHVAMQKNEFGTRAKVFPQVEVLRHVTSNGAKVLALSNLVNPYPGELGAVEEGALADLLIVDGNPLEDVLLLADPEKNLRLIMKDGKTYKNTLV